MGHTDVVKFLLARGASVDLHNSVGGTALMLAAENGNMNIVWALLRAGADPEARNQHTVTALQHAKVMDHTATAQLLRRAMKAIAPPPPLMLSENPELMLGRIVSIIGLPELNGRRGKAARYDGAKDCLDIVLEGGARVVMVKPANLRLFEKACEQKAELPGATPASAGTAGSTQEAAALPRHGKGLLSVLLPSRDQTGRDAARSQPDSYEDCDDSSEELPPDVLLAALLGHLRPVREHLAKGSAVDARAPGRAGGGWTLLMAAAEGGKDGRLRYEQQCAAYREDLRARAERRRGQWWQQQQAGVAAAKPATLAALALSPGEVAAKAVAKAVAKERYTKAYADPAGKHVATQLPTDNGAPAGAPAATSPAKAMAAPVASDAGRLRKGGWGGFGAAGAAGAAGEAAGGDTELDGISLADGSVAPGCLALAIAFRESSAANGLTAATPESSRTEGRSHTPAPAPAPAPQPQPSRPSAPAMHLNTKQDTR